MHYLLQFDKYYSFIWLNNNLWPVLFLFSFVLIVKESKYIISFINFRLSKMTIAVTVEVKPKKFAFHHNHSCPSLIHPSCPLNHSTPPGSLYNSLSHFKMLWALFELLREQSSPFSQLKVFNSCFRNHTQALSIFSAFTLLWSFNLIEFIPSQFTAKISVITP